MSLILKLHERFDEQTADLLRLAARADPLVLNPAMQAIGHEVRASCVVRCAAETEVLFKQTLAVVTASIASSPITVAELTPGLRGYLTPTCRATAPRTPSRTTHVLEVVYPSAPSASAEVSLVEVAGEGRTIRATHFLHVWTIFDLAGSPFDVRGQVALNKIANYRNWVAHGEESAASLSRTLSRQSTDLHTLISTVREVVAEFSMRLDGFLDTLP